ncbi:hypothetical protein CYMTET_56890 [Cymbomonas tetramitiformis]|uniref:Glycosyl transferase 64 domain-containing protein n=1 Tax=Cymbomonas tetramitiformis TaxID=36881 RepID=A0AAE0BBF0_9CHLO|nr:hypothetical protein CYMTET_56890 [Cymbomonas tetramitiformis]
MRYLRSSCKRRHNAHGLVLQGASRMPNTALRRSRSFGQPSSTPVSSQSTIETSLQVPCVELFKQTLGSTRTGRLRKYDDEQCLAQTSGPVAGELGASWSKKVHLSHAVAVGSRIGCQIWSNFGCIPTEERRLIMQAFHNSTAVIADLDSEVQRGRSGDVADTLVEWHASLRNVVALYTGHYQGFVHGEMVPGTLDSNKLRSALTSVQKPQPQQCGYADEDHGLSMHFESTRAFEAIPTNTPKFTIIITTINQQRALYLIQRYNKLSHQVAKVIIVWNGQKPFPELGLASAHKVCVQVFWERDNALNNRYRHHASVPTALVFLTDDDMVVRANVFNTKEWGPQRRNDEWLSLGKGIKRKALDSLKDAYPMPFFSRSLATTFGRLLRSFSATIALALHLHTLHHHGCNNIYNEHSFATTLTGHYFRATAAARHAVTPAAPVSPDDVPVANSAQTVFVATVRTLTRDRFDESVAKHVARTCFREKHARFSGNEAYATMDDATVSVRTEANKLMCFSTLELVVCPTSPAVDWLEASLCYDTSTRCEAGTTGDCAQAAGLLGTIPVEEHTGWPRGEGTVHLRHVRRLLCTGGVQALSPCHDQRAAVDLYNMQQCVSECYARHVQAGTHSEFPAAALADVEGGSDQLADLTAIILDLKKQLKSRTGKVNIWQGLHASGGEGEDPTQQRWLWLMVCG